MGKGIDAARPDAPEHAAAMDDLKDQLLIVFLKRLGGTVDIPLAEVDDTGQDILGFSFKDGIFHFETRKKTMNEIPKADRSQQTLADGSPVSADHHELKENGQQKGYVVLSSDERAKGFVRPVRESYVHKTCGVETRMSRSIAETYARDPGFYSGTFCIHCREHLPLDQFVWSGTDEIVGS